MVGPDLSSAIKTSQRADAIPEAEWWVPGRQESDMETGMRESLELQLAESGWCVVPAVISRDTAAHAVDRLWAAIERNAEEGFSCHLPAIDPNASNVRLLNPLLADPVFRALMENDLALDMARTVVGHDVIIANCTANVARPGARSMALHSDLAFILPEPWLHGWSVNVIWCLTDARPENGATLYVPGSHLWRTHADIPADAAERLVPFSAEAGSIVVMDGRLWHTSGANVTRDEDRALLFGYYSASFLRPMINWTALFGAEPDIELSGRMRGLLGLDVFANTSEGDNQGQGDWRGMPVGREQALADYRRARGR